VARETQGRAIRLFGDPTRGAAFEAPTAPHATDPVPSNEKARPTGPAKFWNPRRVSTALKITLALSLVAHVGLAPWRLFPNRGDIELKDADGELSIPLDILGEEPPPPEVKPPETPTTDDPSKDPNGPNAHKPDAGPPKKDGGPPHDAGPDAEPLAQLDASTDDSGPPSDAGLYAMGDAAVTDAGGQGVVDPTAGVATVNTGEQNIVLVVNSAVIRKHPVGARLGPVIQQIPQWRDFLKGSQSVVDPIHHTDWILIYGPSLIHTDRDAVLVRYNVSDDIVDKAVDAVARTYDKGGPYDAGVPGVVASRGHADNAERIFMRPQPHLLVIAPPAHAYIAAKTYKTNTPRAPSPKEAMHLLVRKPHQQIAIKGLKFKEQLKTIDLWIEPRADGGADVHALGTCTDEQCAIDTADQMNDVIKQQNSSIGVRIATRGLLNNAKVVAEGNKAKLDLVVTQDQLEAFLQLVAAAVGAQVTPPAGGGAGGTNNQ
jgi:hypothetical protein